MSRGKQGVFTFVAALATVATMAVAPAFAVTISGSVAATDERAPEPVSNVDAVLGPDGVEISWDLSPSDFVRQSPAGSDFSSGGTFVNVNDVVAYDVWRSEAGLEPELAGSVGSGETFFLDPLPVGSVFVYSVTAADAAGNKSDPVEALAVSLGPPPVATIDVTPIDLGIFGAPHGILVTNDAEDESSVLSISITVEGLGFESNADGLTLDSGTSSTFEVSFAAVDVGNLNGSYTGTLTIRTNDPDNRKIIIPLSADITEGISQPDIEVSASVLSFGQRVIGAVSAERALSVTNIGGLPLTGSVDLSGDAAFTILGAADFVLEEGDISDYVVTYTPTAVEDNSATITITSDDANQPTIEVEVTGKGVVALALIPKDGDGNIILGWFTRGGTQVGFDDFFAFADNFGSDDTQEGFDPKYDIAPAGGDGSVNFDDFFKFADDFGKTVANASDIQDALQ
tara:strand:+ start:171 stop:1538 length:1368 start_codon:yes stop_codon:yes gene_type:complete